MEYNTDRDLESFKIQLEMIRAAGFNPIAVAQMNFEDTFVFETENEATEAYYTLERDKQGEWIGEVVGWWHGKESFQKAVEQYESEYSNKVLIYKIEKIS